MGSKSNLDHSSWEHNPIFTGHLRLSEKLMDYRKATLEIFKPFPECHSRASSTLSGPSQQLPWCDLAILWPFRPFPRVTTTPKVRWSSDVRNHVRIDFTTPFFWGGHGGIVFIWLKNSMQLGIQSWPCRVWQQVNQLTGSHGLWQRSTDGLWYSQRTHTRQEMDH